MGTLSIPRAMSLDNMDSSASAMVTNDQIITVVSRQNIEKDQLSKLVKSVPAQKRSALVKALVPQLQSPSWEVRVNSAYVLGELGADSATVTSALIRSMQTAQMENVAWEVAKTLSKIGPGAVPELKKALQEAQRQHNPGLSAYRLMEAASALGPAGKDLAPDIVPSLHDGDNSGAIKALTKIGPSSIPAITTELQTTKDGFIPVYAARLLSTLGAVPSTKSLLNALKAGTPTAKKNIAYVFANLKPAPHKSAAPALVSLLNDPSTDTRSDAATALKNLGPAAVPDLLELLSSKDMQTFVATMDLLKHFGPKANTAVPVLTQVMANSEPARSMIAASTILRIDPGNEIARRKLQALMTDHNQGVRAAAMIQAGSAGIGGKTSVATLISGLTDPDPEVRYSAAVSLGNLGPIAKSSVPALIIAATGRHPSRDQGWERIGMDQQIHSAAISALGKIGPGAAAAVPMLDRLIKQTANYNEHDESLDALVKIGPAAATAVPTLTELVSKPGQDQRKIIAVFKAIGPSAAGALTALRRILNDRSNSSRKEAFEAILTIETDQAKVTADAEAVMSDSDSEIAGLARKVIAKRPSGNPVTMRRVIEGLNDSQYNVKLASYEAIGSFGSKAADALPLLINENIGSSFSQPQKDLAFAAIKKIDPSGERTVPLLAKALKDPFQVRGACELLEFINSPHTLELARSTRAHWKI